MRGKYSHLACCLPLPPSSTQVTSMFDCQMQSVICLLCGSLIVLRITLCISFLCHACQIKFHAHPHTHTYRQKATLARTCAWAYAACKSCAMKCKCAANEMLITVQGETRRKRERQGGAGHKEAGRAEADEEGKSTEGLWQWLLLHSCFRSA